MNRAILRKPEGSSPVQRYHPQRPDVLVGDIEMSEEEGFALVPPGACPSRRPRGSTPAIAVTAYARSEDPLKVVLAGFQTHMAKPVEVAELLAFGGELGRSVHWTLRTPVLRLAEKDDQTSIFQDDDERLSTFAWARQPLCSGVTPNNRF